MDLSYANAQTPAVPAGLATGAAGTVPAPLGVAQPSKGLIGCATSIFKKYKKFILIFLLGVVGYVVYKKWGKKNPPATLLTVPAGQPPVQVPPPPAVDPNFTRLTPPTTP